MSRRELIIKVGEVHTLNDLVKRIIDFGYERSNAGAVQPGEFNILGGNIIIFPINGVNPINVDFFGNNIEKINFFNVETGKKIGETKEVKVDANLLILPDGTKINIGDFVVHDDHGIGLFVGFVTKKVDNEELRYIQLEYLRGDRLFVPVDLAEKISPYIGIGRRKPKLNRLGSQSWKKTYAKTYENIILLAKELLQIYAQREIVSRLPWKINIDWDKEARHTFGYKETIDQEKAIRETLKDLEKTIPMDRLICGDVGFGKTEVAIRAATQACANGYQVAILVPTTILCEQHYVMLKDRFKDLPVNIDHLSRMVDTKSQKVVVDKVENAKVDILVGTHRLFGKDIKFKNLGLLIVDEEQKFGVKDKEKLKKLKTEVNILTLTATPIPRTLFMGLSGIRDISLIGVAPKGRKDIETKVAKYDESDIKEYIEREIERGGQVYYLHNEVRTIGGTQNKLRKMFPKLNVEVAHGQMNEKTLAGRMALFTSGKIDVLVCSTIVENGLDLPNANTLIVESADKFGLSQLYQIRGRIGRSPKQAYALFTHKEKKITDNAFKRFKAIVENTELGSGYNIALSDLEIRGGGNILGKEQHGSMEAIGLVLYSKMLNKAVEKLKNKNQGKC